jgi:hypothetical protein
MSTSVANLSLISSWMYYSTTVEHNNSFHFIKVIITNISKVWLLRMKKEKKCTLKIWKEM